jgi:hypothetical protein
LAERHDHIDQLSRFEYRKLVLDIARDYAAITRFDGRHFTCHDLPIPAGDRGALCSLGWSSGRASSPTSESVFATKGSSPTASSSKLTPLNCLDYASAPFVTI